MCVTKMPFHDILVSIFHKTFGTCWRGHRFTDFGLSTTAGDAENEEERKMNLVFLVLWR